MTDSGNQLRIFIVDDHRIVIEGLTVYLHSKPGLLVCGSARNAAEALSAIQKLLPDAVIADLSLENSSGLDLIKDIHFHLPHLPVIVLSMHDELIYAERAMRAGAKGYIMKDQSFERVVDAIHAVTRKDTYFSEAVKTRILNRLVYPSSESGSIVDLLTDRELEVFRLIGQGFRPRHIAEKLNMSIHTVETHCKRIRVKLNLEDMKAIIETATQWLQSAPSSEM